MIYRLAVFIEENKLPVKHIQLDLTVFIHLSGQDFF